MLYTGMKTLTVMVLLQAGAVGNSLIIRRPQAMKCEVEDDLSNEGCTLDMLPELELLAMLERRGINGSEFRAVAMELRCLFFVLLFFCSFWWHVLWGRCKFHFFHCWYCRDGLLYVMLLLSPAVCLVFRFT